MNLNDDWGYPLPPEDAATMIVAELCYGLRRDRQERIKCAIEEWGRAWGDLVASNVRASS
jgi:hypothetical protein